MGNRGELFVMSLIIIAESEIRHLRSQIAEKEDYIANLQDMLDTNFPKITVQEPEQIPEPATEDAPF